MYIARATQKKKKKYLLKGTTDEYTYDEVYAKMCIEDYDRVQETRKFKSAQTREEMKKLLGLGYSFYPLEGMLVDYYLRKKIMDELIDYCLIEEVDNVYAIHPQDLAGLLDPMSSVCDNGGEVVGGDSKIDEEMKEIEKDVSRLLLKLGSLRLEKEARDAKPVEYNAPLCTPKIVDQKETSKISFMPRKIEGSPVVRNGVRSNLRGGGKQEVTPIQPVKNRRGINLGPSEIIASTRSQHRGNQELPPIQSTQNSRQQSCFYKLQEVDEGNILKEKGGRRLSLSPQSRLAQSKMQVSKQRFMTTGSNKTVKKDDRVLFRV
ncbi:hypothetical protein IFM89_031212 [Coptis chinensis]|uniref:Uncharacterized protein n=1 Tax=Coptis chinensis TaxID=261450 RepID=A0A835IS60_9MAGN|nr:hypothetical protein IFM89_031212 [Coptis chinensis]